VLGLIDKAAGSGSFISVLLPALDKLPYLQLQPRRARLTVSNSRLKLAQIQPFELLCRNHHFLNWPYSIQCSSFGCIRLTGAFLCVRATGGC
jgi:hypothetical protein